MQPIDALKILDNAASLAPLSRADHVAIQQATAALLEAINAQQPKAPAAGD